MNTTSPDQRQILLNMAPLSTLQVIAYHNNYYTPSVRIYWYDLKYSSIEIGPFVTIAEAITHYKEVVLKARKVNREHIPVVFVDFKGKKRMDT